MDIVVADDVKRVLACTGRHTGDALLEGSVQLILEKGIGFTRGITQPHDAEVLVMNFRDEFTKGISPKEWL